MSKKNKVIAVLLSLLLAAAILLSYDYIIEETHHDCSGRECPICMQLEEAVQFLSTIKFVPVVPYIVAAFLVCMKKDRVQKENENRNNTLITLKVELLN